jgi:hypothetical protein
MICVLRFMALLGVAAVMFAAEKPSPFVARTSVPAAPPAAPVSPVAPALSVLRATRPRVYSAGTVSPVNRPLPADTRSEAVLSPPPAEKVAPPAIPKPMPVEVPAMVVAQVQPPRVSDVERGVSKADVVLKIGNPTMAISMYEDNRFHESLRYEWNGKWLGTVRLVNGRVERIDQP